MSAAVVGRNGDGGVLSKGAILSVFLRTHRLHAYTHRYIQALARSRLHCVLWQHRTQRLYSSYQTTEAYRGELHWFIVRYFVMGIWSGIWSPFIDFFSAVELTTSLTGKCNRQLPKSILQKLVNEWVSGTMSEFEWTSKLCNRPASPQMHQSGSQSLIHQWNNSFVFHMLNWAEFQLNPHWNIYLEYIWIQFWGVCTICSCVLWWILRCLYISLCGIWSWGDWGSRDCKANPLIVWLYINTENFCEN